MELIFFDLETTGVDIFRDKIVQLSAIKTDDNLKIIEKKKILINPVIPIPKEASDVHGITDEMVKDCATFNKYASGIYLYFDNAIIAGYNSDKFDIPLLSEELKKCGFNWNPKTTIDCCSIFKNREKRDLTSALKFYVGKDMQGAHDAENDVLATIEILEGQMFKYDLDLNAAILESKGNNVDIAGTIVIKNGVPCYNIGKAKGDPVTSNIGFGQWMLRQDFSVNTKNVVRSLISQI